MGLARSASQTRNSGLVGGFGGAGRVSCAWRPRLAGGLLANASDSSSSPSSAPYRLALGSPCWTRLVLWLALGARGRQRRARSAPNGLQGALASRAKLAKRFTIFTGVARDER